MRVRMMSEGSEGVVKWQDQSRVRIRVARSVAVLVPSITTSVLATLPVLCADVAPESGTGMCEVMSDSLDKLLLVPVCHLMFLVVCFVCAEGCSKLKPPATNRYRKAPPSAQIVVLSPASLWFAL